MNVVFKPICLEFTCNSFFVFFTDVGIFFKSCVDFLLKINDVNVYLDKINAHNVYFYS